MRVGFAGTPAFAAAALEAILDASLPVAVVLTQPDRARDRGWRPKPSPVKSLAAARGIAVLQPASLKAAEERAPIIAITLDVLVVAAYGLILPESILEWPAWGCINIHASLLPRWRGAAPIQRALLAGDRETGVAIMRMDKGLDTGPIIARHAVPIAARETAGSLHDKLAAVGARAIVSTLSDLRRDGRLPAEAQPDEGATYATKLDPAETVIDWSASADAIARSVRAFDPAPGARTTLAGAALKIWEASPLPGRFGAPGVVAWVEAAGIVVACGEGALNVTRLQRAGGKRMPAAAFLAGHELATGTRLGATNR
ncbi:MAG: methionyl-tRNA formyltransferase [Pseudomonadota bacterium]|nr:methionyl-tRNA formyltransferase [Pseudomonadota bacterium]